MATPIVVDESTGISEEAYNSLLMKLFPKGRAWVGSNIETLMMAFAKEIKRASDAIDSIINNAIPFTSTDYLVDWERVCGLDIAPVDVSEESRRASVISKLRSTGGQSKAYFISIASTLGKEITIKDDIDYFHAGSSAGDSTNGIAWVFTFIVSIAGSVDTNLEYTINRLKPAHTVAIFEYV